MINNLYSFHDVEYKHLDSKITKVKSQIKSNTNQIKKLLSIEPKTFQNFALPLFELEEALNFEFQPISHLNGVANSKKTQKAIKELLPLLSEYSTKLSQNRAVYDALKHVYETDKLDEEQKMSLKLELLDFEMEGVSLDGAKKSKI